MSKVLLGRKTEESTVGGLSDVFQVAHGEVDCHQACVDTAGSGQPDGPVGVERGAKELALFLWLFTYAVVSWCVLGSLR